MRLLIVNVVTLILMTTSGCLIIGCGTNQVADDDSAPDPRSVPQLKSPPKIRVSIDGQAIDARLESIGSDGKSAALLLDVGITLALGTERDFNLTWEGSEFDQLFLHVHNQPKRLVGVKVHTNYDFKNDKDIVINPLASLDEAQIRQLWGIEVDHWSNEIALQGFLDRTKASPGRRHYLTERLTIRC